MGRLTYNDRLDTNCGELAYEIKEVLRKAIFYYLETLKLVSSKEVTETWETHITCSAILKQP